MPTSAEQPHLLQFVQLAQAFCALVESEHTVAAETVMQDLHLLVARLYAAALVLPAADALLTDEEVGTDSPTTRAGTLLDRTAVVARLAPVFGERNSYREVFDPYERATEGTVMGTLTDDVSDIYGHLRTGLDYWNEGSFGNALFEWRFGFETHWAEHATSALRALFARSAWYDIGWPCVGPA